MPDGSFFNRIFNHRSANPPDVSQRHSLNVLRDKPPGAGDMLRENTKSTPDEHLSEAHHLSENVSTERTSDKTVSKLEQRLRSFEQAIEKVNNVVHFDSNSLPGLEHAEQERLDNIQKGMQDFAGSHQEVYVRVQEQLEKREKQADATTEKYQNSLKKLHQEKSNANTDEKHFQIDVRINQLMQTATEVIQKQQDNKAWREDLKAIVGQHGESFVTSKAEGIDKDHYDTDQVMLSGDLNRRHVIVDSDLARLQQVGNIYQEQIQKSQERLSHYQTEYQTVSSHVRESEKKVLQADGELKSSYRQYEDALAEENLHGTSSTRDMSFSSEKEREWQVKRAASDALKTNLKQQHNAKDKLQKSLRAEEGELQKLEEAFYPVSQAISLGENCKDSITRLKAEMPELANDSRLAEINKAKLNFYQQKSFDLHKSKSRLNTIAADWQKTTDKIFSQKKAIGSPASDRRESVIQQLDSLRFNVDVVQERISQAQKEFKQKITDLQNMPEQAEIAKAGLRDIAHIEHFRPKNPEAVENYNKIARAEYKERYRTEIKYNDFRQSWEVSSYVKNAREPFATSAIISEQGIFRAQTYFKDRQMLSPLYKAAALFIPKDTGYFDADIKVGNTKPLHASKVHYNQIEDFKEHLAKLRDDEGSTLHGHTIPEFDLKQFDEVDVINSQSRKVMKVFLPRASDEKRFGDGSAGLYASAKRKTSKGTWFVGYHYNKRPGAIKLSRVSLFNEKGKKVGSSQYYASTYFSDL